MIRALARTIRLSAFSALLAYVLVLNVFLAGFAQAAAFEHTVNGGTEICLTGINTDQNASTNTIPGKSSLHHCQTCCLFAHSALPPVAVHHFERLIIVSAQLFPLESTGSTFAFNGLHKARAPPSL